jgi:hypothetical protein
VVVTVVITKAVADVDGDGDGIVTMVGFDGG